VAQQLEPGAAAHGPLDRLQAADLPLHGPGAPWQRQRGPDRTPPGQRRDGRGPSAEPSAAARGSPAPGFRATAGRRCGSPRSSADRGARRDDPPCCRGAAGARSAAVPTAATPAPFGGWRPRHARCAAPASPGHATPRFVEPVSPDSVPVKGMGLTGVSKTWGRWLACLGLIGLADA